MRQTNNPSQRSERPKPAITSSIFLFGLLLLVVFVAALIASWETIVAVSGWLIPILGLLVGVAIPCLLLVIGVLKEYLAWVRLQHAREELLARQDERRRTNEEHETKLYLLRTRLPANRAQCYVRCHRPQSKEIFLAE
jgi:hypothetical protein